MDSTDRYAQGELDREVGDLVAGEQEDARHHVDTLLQLVRPEDQASAMLQVAMLMSVTRNSERKRREARR